MGSSGYCAGCSGAITLVHARPVVATDGRVALWCRTCWPRRAAIAKAAAAPSAPSPSLVVTVGLKPPRRPRTVSAIELPAEPQVRKRTTAVAIAAGLTIAAAAAVAVIGTAVPASSPGSKAPVTVAAAVTPANTIAPPAAPVAPAAAAPVAPAAAEPVEPVTNEGTADPAISVNSQTEAIDLATLEEDRPTLLDWVHPVTGTDELVPLRGTRRFGAKREGLSRTLCGEGHCGVDLSGPRGRPVVAVAWGTVVRVEHSARGRDGRSGRYVRIEHPEGVFTSYMHLDAIQADIKVGDEVAAGTVLGTLGKTAIYHGEQHLHFGLEIEDHGAFIYVDPSPFLSRAQVVPIPDQPLNLTPTDEREQW